MNPLSPDDARHALAHAAPAPPPLPDLAPAVLSAIAQRRQQPGPDRILPTAAGISLTLALIAAVWAFNAWSSLDNPLAPLSPTSSAQLAEGP
ncbi:MAG TPA: hypothetical protein VH253_18780 [Phycisphaerae bacterium]|nr:hypothetical protein [Phycisphaerae bacterium]